ncbi:hypothetical protein V5799_004541 [Amblyomma americanum]|uniref:Secreted protein n=1 Tax=Amblyomma americanum TaxID=6943 RepID=A0AAQ4D5T2_AMBAM
MKAFFVLLAAAVAICAADTDEAERPVFKFPPDPQPCGTNEEWKQCVSGSCAETTCKKRDSTGTTKGTASRWTSALLNKVVQMVPTRRAVPTRSGKSA